MQGIGMASPQATGASPHPAGSGELHSVSCKSLIAAPTAQANVPFLGLIV